MAAPKPGETGDLFSQVRPRAMGVGELTRLLRAQVEPRFRDVWVAGEVSNLRRQSSGHLYFSLKDDEASILAVVWAAQARRLKFAPGDEPDRRGAARLPARAPRALPDDAGPRLTLPGAGRGRRLDRRVGGARAL